jgi:hypothetical protein
LTWGTKRGGDCRIVKANRAGWRLLPTCPGTLLCNTSDFRIPDHRDIAHVTLPFPRLHDPLYFRR